MDQDQILQELLGLYEQKGPGNYYLADSLKCFQQGDTSYGVTLNRLLAEGLIIGQEIDPESKRVAIALNPERVPDVRRELSKETSGAPRQSVFGKILLLVLVLGFGLLGLWLLPNAFSQALWFFFCLVCYPIVLAFTHGSATLTEGQLLGLYRTGVGQVPVIGEILTKLIPGGSRRS